MRTFFMMTGTLVGIGALTVILAFGKGANKKIMKRVKTFGPNAIMLIAGGGKDLPPPDMKVTTLTVDDARAIRESVKGLAMVSPMAWSFGVGVSREGKLIKSRLWGVEPSWHKAWRIPAVQGEPLSGDDVASMARTCLLGASVVRELFGKEDPVGQYVTVNKVRLRVKGVLKPRGVSPMGRDFDKYLILPITTAQRRVLNITHVGAIRIIVKDPKTIPQTVKAVRALVHDRHRITPPREDDFRMITPLVIAQLARGMSGTLSKLLIALAALGLLVGGVVMMNILMISVGERTREIGLRRALGARAGDIFHQFLGEAMLVTFSGMVLGLGAGWGATAVLCRLKKIPLLPSWEPFVLALAFSLLVGLLFGVLPAKRAAAKQPADALR
jgi:ABC-type antimicrobial peptide transport system permease subunit